MVKRTQPRPSRAIWEPRQAIWHSSEAVISVGGPSGGPTRGFTPHLQISFETGLPQLLIGFCRARRFAGAFRVSRKYSSWHADCVIPRAGKCALQGGCQGALSEFRNFSNVGSALSNDLAIVPAFNLTLASCSSSSLNPPSCPGRALGGLHQNDALSPGKPKGIRCADASKVRPHLKFALLPLPTNPLPAAAKLGRLVIQTGKTPCRRIPTRGSASAVPEHVSTNALGALADDVPLAVRVLNVCRISSVKLRGRLQPCPSYPEL